MKGERGGNELIRLQRVQREGKERSVCTEICTALPTGP